MNTKVTDSFLCGIRARCEVFLSQWRLLNFRVMLPRRKERHLLHNFHRGDGFSVVERLVTFRIGPFYLINTMKFLFTKIRTSPFLFIKQFRQLHFLIIKICIQISNFISERVPAIFLIFWSAVSIKIAFLEPYFSRCWVSG